MIKKVLVFVLVFINLQRSLEESNKQVQNDNNLISKQRDNNNNFKNNIKILSKLLNQNSNKIQDKKWNQIKKICQKYGIQPHQLTQISELITDIIKIKKLEDGESKIKRILQQNDEDNVDDVDTGDVTAAYGVPIVIFLSLLCVLCVWVAKKDKDYSSQYTILSLHPLYSVARVSSPINLKSTRTLLYWMTISSMSFAPAIFFSWIKYDNKWGVDIVYGTLCALIFSWIINYLLGFFHYIFIRKRVDHPAVKLVEVITLTTIIAFFICSMIAVIDMDRDVDAGLWAACLGIAWLLDTILFDPIVTFLGKFKLFRKWFEIRGFYVEPQEQQQPNIAQP